MRHGSMIIWLLSLSQHVKHGAALPTSNDKKDVLPSSRGLTFASRPGIFRSQVPESSCLGPEVCLRSSVQKGTGRLECDQCQPHYELTHDGCCQPCVVCTVSDHVVDFCPIYSKRWGGVVPQATDGTMTFWPNMDEEACAEYVKWGADGYDVEDPDKFYCSTEHPVAWVYTITVNQFESPMVDGVSRPVIAMKSGEDTEYKIPGRPVSACGEDTIVAIAVNNFSHHTAGRYAGTEEEAPLGGNSEADIRMGFTLHWHGMLQAWHQIMDGVAMISQCPIGPNVPVEKESEEAGTPSHYVYRMLANPSGTYWFHSHTGLQYGDGLFAPLLVYQRADSEHNPYYKDYQKELGTTLMIGDWWHHLSQAAIRDPKHNFSSWQKDLVVNLFYGPEKTDYCPRTQSHCIPRNNRGAVSTFNCYCGGRTSDYAWKSGYINGVGQYDHKYDPRPQHDFMIANYNYTEIQVEPSTTYRVRIINSGFNYGFRFSIDDHDYRVIAADGGFVQSVDDVTHLSSFPGERYDILLTTKSEAELANLGTRQFFIRATTYQDSLWHFDDTANQYTTRFTGDTHTVFAVLNYDAGSTEESWFQPGQPLNLTLDAFLRGEKPPPTRRVVDISQFYGKEQYMQFENTTGENVVQHLQDFRFPDHIQVAETPPDRWRPADSDNSEPPPSQQPSLQAKFGTMDSAASADKCTEPIHNGKGPIGAPFGCSPDGKPLPIPRPDYIQVLMVVGIMYPQYQLMMATAPLQNYTDWYDPVTDEPLPHFKKIYSLIGEPNVWARSTVPLVHTRGDPKYNRDLPVYGPPLNDTYSDPNNVRPLRRWGLSPENVDYGYSPMNRPYTSSEKPGITNKTVLNKLPYKKWVRFVHMNGGPMAHPFHIHGYDVYMLGREAIDIDKVGLRDLSTAPCRDKNQDKERQPYLFEVSENCERCGSAWFNAWGSDLIPPIDRRQSNMYTAESPPLNTETPARRDMMVVPPHSYMVYQMYTDNPGVWFYHCHLEFHAGLGMATSWIIGDEPGEPWLLQGATNNQLKQAEQGLCADIEFEGPVQFP